MATTQYNAAGFERVQVGRSSGGLPYYGGLTGGSASGYGLTRLYAANAADATMPEPTTVPIEGDDGIDAQFQFDVTELETFQLTFGRQDYAVLNDVQGTSNIDLQSTYSMALRNPKGRDFTDMFVLLSRRAQKRNGTTGGGYEHVLIPLATLTYTGSTMGTQGAGYYNYSVTANYVDRTFYGTKLGSDASEVGGKDNGSSFEFVTDYPVSIDVWEEDGSATDFTPTQTIRTSGTVLAWSWDKTATAASTKSVSVSSGDITFTAGTDGDLIVAIYEVAS